MLEKTTTARSISVERGLMLNIFLLISFLTVICSFLLIFSNIIAILIEVYYYNVIAIDICGMIIRFYIIIISIVIIFTEMEWTDTIRSIVILQSWFFRGLLYNFGGLLTYDEKNKFVTKITSNANVVADLNKDCLYITKELLSLSSISLIIFGILYAIMVY